MPEPVQKLWVTLHRSFAGTKETHIKTAQALGLSKLQQTIAHPNTASVRGAVDKVQAHSSQLCSQHGKPPEVYPAYFLQIKHLVRVETDVAREARLAAEATAAAPKNPVVVQHSTLR